MQQKKQRTDSSETLCGAGNGVRTRGPKLGKLVLCQLSYTRSSSALRSAVSISALQTFFGTVNLFGQCLYSQYILSCQAAMRRLAQVDGNPSVRYVFHAASLTAPFSAIMP
jgi:hypothetical protein